MSVFAFAFVLYFFIGRRFAKINPLIGNVVAQILFLGLLPALAAFYFRLNFKNTFYFQPPKLKQIFPAIIMILSALVIARELSVFQREYFYGSMKELTEAMKQLGHFKLSLGFSIIAFAIVPGICEEFLFRGALLSSFRRRFSPSASIVIVAILFSLMHMMLANFAFYFVLGVVLGYLVIKTNSIFVGMLAHFCSNASAVFLEFIPKGEITKSFANDTHLPLSISISSVIVFGITLFIFKKLNKE